MGQQSILMIKTLSNSKNLAPSLHCVALKDQAVIVVTHTTSPSVRKAGGVPDVSSRLTGKKLHQSAMEVRRKCSYDGPSDWVDAQCLLDGCSGAEGLDGSSLTSILSFDFGDFNPTEFMTRLFPLRTLDEHCQITSSCIFRTRSENEWRLWRCVNISFQGRSMMFVKKPKNLPLHNQECKTSLMALLELGNQIFQSKEVILCLQKDQFQEIDLYRSIKTLMYVGFSLVSPAVYGHDSSFVLLGYEN